MSNYRAEEFLRWVLLVNGIVDLILGAFLIIFPMFGLPIPGYYYLDEETIFVAGGWGISTIALGISRIMTTYYPKFYYAMAFIGILEGTLLAVFSMVSVFLLDMPVGKVALAWAVGAVFGAAYGVSFLLRGRGRGDASTEMRRVKGQNRLERTHIPRGR